MSWTDQLKSTATKLTRTTKRQSKRAQREMQAKQLERKMNAEYARIGRALAPLLEQGSISTDNAEVQAALASLGELRDRRAEAEREIEELKHPEPDAATDGVTPDAEAPTGARDEESGLTT